MNEARASFNAYFRSPNGNKDQFTLRQADDQSDKDFVLRVSSFMKLLTEQGWAEWSAGDEPAAPAADTTRDSASTFPVESIKLAAGGDHPRWVVKGGNFKKFGVTCWPETLEAAGIAEKLDPLKDNKPKGRWMARYNERQNDEGRWVPDKVLELVKA
jgi:hypothetical protein